VQTISTRTGGAVENWSGIVLTGDIVVDAGCQRSNAR
jgi:hypothetical protein